MSEPFLGEIMMVGFNYAPRYWAMCQGQTLSIQQNTALFALLGTTFGGNGSSTFQLPNLQASIPLHRSTNASNPLAQGQVGGVPSHVLQASELPAHTHTVNVNNAAGTGTSCMNAWLSGMPNAYIPVGTSGAPTLTNLNPNTLALSGTGAAHENRQPFVCVNYIIALSGIFPSRN